MWKWSWYTQFIIAPMLSVIESGFPSMKAPAHGVAMNKIFLSLIFPCSLLKSWQLESKLAFQVKLRSRDLISKGKYFASQRRGNSKNVNSSTESCVTSFLLSRVHFAELASIMEGRYEHLETMALKSSRRSYWWVNKFDVLSKLKYYTKGKKLSLFVFDPPVVESQSRHFCIFFFPSA